MDSSASEIILSQWLSSILSENIGQAGDQISDFLFSTPVCYQLSCGAWLIGGMYMDCSGTDRKCILLFGSPH